MPTVSCGINPDLDALMDLKGYTYEAHYIKTIWNWRRACDELGLSALEHSKFNYQFLTMIPDELMPWDKPVYEISLLEVNQFVNVLIPDFPPGKTTKMSSVESLE